MSSTVFAAVITALLFPWFGPDRIAYASIALCVGGALIGTIIYLGVRREAEKQADAPNMFWALPDIVARTVLGCFALLFPIVWEWGGETGYGAVFVVSAIVAGVVWFATANRMRKRSDGFRLVFAPVVLTQLVAYATYEQLVGADPATGDKPLAWTVATLCLTAVAVWLIRSTVPDGVVNDGEGKGTSSVDVTA